MPFTVAEKERIRYHLGYMNVGSAASITYGLPKPSQMLFAVDLAMNLILPEGEDRVRRILGVLDCVEDKLIGAEDRLAATQLGDLKLRDQEPDLLEKEYKRWASRLADILGVPLYAYATRFRNVRAGNISMS